VLADFIETFKSNVPYLSCNLDFGPEPALSALAGAGRIKGGVLLEKSGVKIGIVGATTETLKLISSPRNVAIDTDVTGAIQAQIDGLGTQGAQIIIVISHLQSISNDLELAGQLHGVDIMVAGGGDELLANSGDPLVPGDEELVFDTYPIYAANADGVQIPIVTTQGDYKYVGKLVAEFDEDGKLIEVDTGASGPVRVAGGSAPDAVQPDAALQSAVVEPVKAAVDSLEANVIATSAVPLDGNRSPGVRTQETNLGSLCADSLLWQAQQTAAQFGANLPNVAIQNGGGIRNNSLIPAGNITELDTFSILPFANFVCVVEDVPPATFRQALEQGVSAVETAGGSFAQVSGVSFFYDLSFPARKVSPDGTQTQAGQRVRQAWLADGTPWVVDGEVLATVQPFNVATIDFTARGGDGYPLDPAHMVVLGASYQQALENYIRDGLDGAIMPEQYPAGGTARITTTSTAAMQFTHLASYSSGLGEASCEISAYDSKTRRLFIINTADSSLEVVDVAVPSNPVKLDRLTLSFGSPNSVAAFAGHVAVAVEADPKTDPGKVLFLDARTLDEIGSADVGALPDMVCFSPDGQRVLVANEGEPSTDYTADPEGSVSIIDVSGGFSNPPVATAGFTSFDSQRAALRASGVRIYGIFNGESSVAQDIEPEYITVSSDGNEAWVTCQENNAIATIDVAGATVTALAPLGFKDHLLAGNSLDASDKDDAAALANWPLHGMYEPDTIAGYSVDGEYFLLTANEGDARDWDAYAEESRIKDLTLDPAAFPDAAALQEDEAIGRLNVTTAQGDTDGDGDFDVLYSMGGRSFSIWNASAEQVFDSGNSFETYFAANLPDYFNGEFDPDGPEYTFDDRSDNKGAEPEGAAVGFYCGRWLGFVGLERQGGFFVYDVSDPAAPDQLGWFNNADYAAGTGDVSPEGFVYVPAFRSPTYKPLLFVSHEISGSVGIWQLEAAG
jgi:2',3'-cyclic-nucleotide 2'-phosphodiesterase (5'-nucleotidase family)